MAHPDSIITRAGILFRLARNNPEDCARFCELFNYLYSRHVDGNYYRWQFFSTPFPSYLTLAITSDDKLAGCYGFHVLPSRPEAVQIAWALDIMIAPAFQGQGLFRPLAAFALAQVHAHQPVALCVMANPRADGAHVGGLGWHRVNTLLNCVCLTLASQTNMGTMEFCRVQDFNAAAIEALSIARDRPGAETLRSAEYLNWRFCRNPWYNYISYLAHRRGQPFGYLVLKVFQDPQTGQTSGDIVDLRWANDDPDALTEMLAFAATYFATQGVEQAAIWLQTNTMLDQVGRSVGFAETEQKRYFCCKVLDERYRWLEEPHQWLVTMADAEIY